MSDEEIAAGKRATERARFILKPGDRLTVTHCPGTKRWIVFDGWDGDWICSRTRNDYHASHVSKVNGVPTSFRD